MTPPTYRAWKAEAFFGVETAATRFILAGYRHYFGHWDDFSVGLANSGGSVECRSRRLSWKLYQASSKKKRNAWSTVWMMNIKFWHVARKNSTLDHVPLTHILKDPNHRRTKSSPRKETTTCKAVISINTRSKSVEHHSRHRVANGRLLI